MAAIFVSYRSADSADVTGRISDRLVARFGKSNVYRDVEHILAGNSFAERIMTALKKCSCVVVIIGPRWLGEQGEGLERLIDDEEDWVRREVEEAIKRRISIIPVYVRGARHLRSVELPTPLARLGEIQGLVVRYDPHFHDDVKQLKRRVAAKLRKRTRPRSLFEKIGKGAAALGGIYLAWMFLVGLLMFDSNDIWGSLIMYLVLAVGSAVLTYFGFRGDRPEED